MDARLTLIVSTVFAIVGLLGLSAHAGLIGYYSFDGGNADDGSGAGNDGTAGSNIVFSGADVPFGSGLSSEAGSGGGASRVITVPTSSSLEALNHQFTVSFWMKATTGDNDNWVRIFQKGTEGNGSQTWLIDRFSNTARTNMRVDTTGTGGQHNQNIATGGPDTFDGEWHHVLYSIDAGNWEKVVDTGVTTGTYNHGQGLSNTRPIYIFGRNGAGQYVGLLDDIGIWDEPLSEAEGKAVHNVAVASGLAYGADDAQKLFELFDAGRGSATIGNYDWVHASGLGGAPGDVLPEYGALYSLVLDGNGNGLTMAPEPTTVLVWSLLSAAGIGLGWRRRK